METADVVVNGAGIAGMTAMAELTRDVSVVVRGNPRRDDPGAGREVSDAEHCGTARLTRRRSTKLSRRLRA
ncbi:hypothetical protein [Ilumatobacter sp.]|uniref:hypothetical protein n=1 Tax=Ilumatobacter sp. TaxID=1967498 RepID=UPI00375048B1